MDTLTKNAPIRTREDPPDIFHMLCCEENIAMCGTDVTDLPDTDGTGEQQCVVCVELDEGNCPKCGC
jgi:hypothetical protein